MGFSIRPVDITRYSCDVVINSLGLNTTVYGKLCQNIVKEANSFEYKKKLNDINGKVKVGDLIITPGYQLKAKYIYNVVTPYYKQDRHLYALESLYTKVLMEAIKHKQSKIAVPIIGTGANGYPHIIVYRMVEELLKAFVEAYPQMKVTLCMPVASQDEYIEKFDKDKLIKSLDNFYKDNEVFVRTFAYSKSYFDSFDDDYCAPAEVCFVEEMRCPRPKERPQGHLFHPFINESTLYLESGIRPVKFDMNKLCILSVTEYIETYIKTRWVDDDQIKVVRKYIGDEFLNTSLKAKHNNPSKRTTISPEVLMRYVLTLHMNEEEAKDFFLFCGRGFSPVSAEDVIYLYLINHKVYSQAEVNSCCAAKKIHVVFYT